MSFLMSYAARFQVNLLFDFFCRPTCVIRPEEVVFSSLLSFSAPSNKFDSEVFRRNDKNDRNDLEESCCCSGCSPTEDIIASRRFDNFSSLILFFIDLDVLGGYLCPAEHCFVWRREEGVLIMAFFLVLD